MKEVKKRVAAWPQFSIESFKLQVAVSRKW